MGGDPGDPPGFHHAGPAGATCFIESVNGKLRDEGLNQHHFPTLADAPTALEARREEDNADRPHRSLAQRTPAEYAALVTPGEGPSSLLALRS